MLSQNVETQAQKGEGTCLGIHTAGNIQSGNQMKP